MEYAYSYRKAPVTKSMLNIDISCIQILHLSNIDKEYKNMYYITLVNL